MIRTALVLLLLAAAPHAGVVVVDPAGGPGGAALLQAAMDAAQPGDILLLKEGDYSSPTPLVMAGKGLTLIADVGHDVEIPGLYVQVLPASQTVLLRGLELTPPPAFPLTLFVNGDGSAWVEDCSALGPDDGPATLGNGGAHFDTPRNVVVRGHFQGGAGKDASAAGFDATRGGIGLNFAADVSVVISVVIDATATGGTGGGGTFFLFPPDGGAGLAVIGLESFLLGGTFTGGDEGLAVPATTHGGPGASFDSLTVHLHDATFVPGGVTGAGFPGVPVDSFFATVTRSPAPVRLLKLNSPVRELDTAHVHAKGLPGDFLLVLSSLGMTIEKTAGGQWPFVVAADSALPTSVLGVIGGTGTLDVDFTMPLLPAGMDGTTIFSQLVTLPAGGQPTLGGASTLTWISSAY